MDVFEAIYTRRSIRKFLDVPIEFDKLVEVIKAGSYAPCAGDLQNWRFIVVTNTAVIREMYHHTLEQDAFMTASAAVIVVAEIDTAEKFYGMRGKRLYAVQNCAAAIENMLLAAHGLGLGAVWIGAFDENRINDMFKIPSTARAQAVVLLGYPDEKPQARRMKDPWFLINFNRYGLKYEHPHLITYDLSEEWPRHRDSLARLTGHVARQTARKMGVEEKPGGNGTADGVDDGSLAAKSRTFLKSTGNDTKQQLSGLLKKLKKEPKKGAKKQKRK